MRIFSTVLLFCLAAWPAFAQVKEPAADTPDRKTVNGFGGFLIVVENPEEFIQEWLKPETPNIKTATDVNRGDKIGAFVLFAGCKPSAAGLCNAEVDYTVFRPDGTVLAERKAQPLWKEEVPPAPITQLGRAILAFSLGEDAAAGDYRLRAKISDLNAKISFELQTHFRLK